MATESPEYKTLKHHAANIQLELQNNLDRFSIVLVGKGLITPDQSIELRNRFHPESKRASDLVSWILRKVEQNVGCYYDFFDALKDESLYFGAFLRKLEKTLTDFRGQEGNIMIVYICLTAAILSYV